MLPRATEPVPWPGLFRFTPVHLKWEAGLARFWNGRAVRYVLALALAGGCLLLQACREQPSTVPDPTSAEDGNAGWFRDMTATSGVDFTYRNGQEANQYAILESLGGGVALLDYDGDGLLDIFVTGGGYFAGPKYKEVRGYPCKLYKNLGNWRFKDVTHEAGLDTVGGKPWFYTNGAAVADYDRDGFPDLLVSGYGRVALFHNVPDPKTGGRRFEEVTQKAGLNDHGWSTSAAWVDLDGDGYPDLYICHYVDWSPDNNPVCEGYSPEIPRDVCPPREFDAVPHVLYRNNGNGTFTDVSKEAGIRTVRTPADYRQLSYLPASSLATLKDADHERDFGKGLGVIALDLNGDGRPDLYVTNDTTPNLLYINRSTPGRIRLEELAGPAGVAVDDLGVPHGSMGVDAADYDGSGRPSLLVASYENEFHCLYHNLSSDGQPLFEFASRRAGITSIGRSFVGFGLGFLDIDNRGWEDVVIVNGHVIRHPTHTGVRQWPVLLANRPATGGKPGRVFLPEMDQGGSYFQDLHQARGLAIGDLDNDGLPDLVISHLNAPVTILRNVTASRHHWLGVELVDPSHRDLVGAKLALRVEGRLLTRFTKGGGSYLSSADRRHLFGLADAKWVGRLTVTWPWGKTQSWDGLGIDCYWRLIAGRPEAEPFLKPR
jgi:enediyne biosynthesis protein E4